MIHTHLLVEVDGVAHERGVVHEVEARAELRHVALPEQLVSQLHARARVEHSAVPQAVDHDDHVVVELAESLPADVEGLLTDTFQKEKLREWGRAE